MRTENKNILFVTSKEVNPIIGGIERITYTLAKEFKRQFFYLCYSLYTIPTQCEEDDTFTGKALLPSADNVAFIENIIRKWKIDIVIAQGSDSNVNALMPQLREAIDRVENCKLLFVFHNMPGFELISMDWNVLLHRALYSSLRISSVKQMITQCVSLLLPKISQRIIRSKYLVPYQCADRVILLSEGFKIQYDALAKMGVSKMEVIRNAKSFSDEECVVTEKKKTVLMVTRLDERHKRVKHAIKIWKKIIENGDFDEWMLKIVGYGQDDDYYKSYCQKNKVKNISFEGLQKPLKYYLESSIFMMTSAFEGFPMTLVEAQQNGVVPIAFDSFSAVYDTIKDGETGYVIPNNQLDLYAQKVMHLMTDEETLKKMSLKCREFSQYFSVDLVAQEWKKLFDSL